VIALALLSILLQNAGNASFEDVAAQAKKAWEEHRDAEAIDLYARLVKIRPEWPDGWWALGMLHYDASRYTACRQSLEHMVKADPTAAAGWALLGLCEFQTKSYAPAFQHLKRAHLMVVPGHGGPLLDSADYHLGLLLTQQGAFELAHEVLLRVAQHLKPNPDLIFACGLPSLRIALLPEQVSEGQREVVSLAGKAFWDLATQHPAEAEADFAALVAKYPRFPNVHYFFGTYLAVHRPEAAAAEFQEELRLNPESVPARVQLTLRCLLDQRLDEALKVARQAVELSPESVGAQLALGRALRASGDDQAALAAFLEAKRLDAESPEIRLYLVGAYRALGKSDDMHREQAEHDRLQAAQKNWR
jgi:tetratricopeptide (TPR) repeat protein